MTANREMPGAGTPEFFAARQVAAELMIRALYQMHPQKELVRVYMERMLGQTLAQPYLVLHPGHADLVKSTAEGFLAPPLNQLPED